MIGLLRLVGPQGVAGIAVACCLALLLTVQKVETRHWRKQSVRFEELVRKGEAERARILAETTAVTAAARASDRANALRVEAEQAAINRSSDHDFQARLARARAASRRLLESPAAADRGGPGGAAMPGLSAAPREPAQAPGQDRLPDPDRLTATEQAIQLDELIKWVRAQSLVDPSRSENE